MRAAGLHAGGDKRRDRQRGSGDWRSNADSYDAADETVDAEPQYCRDSSGCSDRKSSGQGTGCKRSASFPDAGAGTCGQGHQRRHLGCW